MRIEAGRFRGRRLPAARGARPVGGRLRRSLFGVLGDRIPGARVLDVFAGVGGLGLEALSRGAAHVCLVEKDPRAAAALEAWIEAAGARGEAQVVWRDALRGALPAGAFDVVFLDPPFVLWESGAPSRLLARAIGRLASGGVVAAKLPARQNLPADPRWRLMARRDVGSVGWALFEATGAGPPASSRGRSGPMWGR